MKNSGQRAWTMIPYDETFRILTLPTSSKGTAKIEPGRGFKLNYIYYYNDMFKNTDVEGKQVPIRYDPFNLGIAYAFVNKRWVKCMSDHYAVFNGRSEKQIQMATREIKKRYQKQNKDFKMNIKIIADFLRDCDSDEILLQQAKENEVKSLSVVTKGEKQTNTTESLSTLTTSITTSATLAVNLEIDINDEVIPDERYGDF